MYIGFTSFIGKGFFSCTLTPAILIQMLPPEEGFDNVYGGDFKMAIGFSFLFWQGIVCFWRYSDAERKVYLNKKYGKR